MSAEAKPKWKRAISLTLRVYAGFCTVILTAYLGLLAWSNFWSQSPPGSEEITLMSAYGRYMATEFPKRGDNFCGVAQALEWRSRAVPISRADVLKYLGKPDYFDGDSETSTLVFTYTRAGVNDRWEVFAFLRDGKLVQVGFNGASANDHSKYRPYPAEVAPNEQGGADGRQPFRLETNRTSAAAASRGSP